MITEEMLKQAAQEAGNIIADSLQTQEEYRHEFSKAFESNMGHILQEAKQKKKVLSTGGLLFRYLCGGRQFLFSISSRGKSHSFILAERAVSRLYGISLYR